MSASGDTEIEQAPPVKSLPSREPSSDPSISAAGDSPARISISRALNGTDNALGFIRLALASLVIFDHAFPLGGFGADPFFRVTLGQASLGSLAVGGFFAISGYLIAKSGMSGDVVQFMWRRSLRIFPAYWTVLLVTAFIAGPLIWVVDGNGLIEYFGFGVGGPVYYFFANWTLQIGTYGIYDLLATTTPYGLEIGSGAFNGSIWTLIYEWTCYLIIAVFVAFGVLRNARILVPIVAAFFLVMQIVATVDMEAVQRLVPRLGDVHLLNLGLIFMAGAVIAVYSKQIPYDDRLGILSGIVLVLSLRWGGFTTIGSIAGAYFVMYMGARLPRQIHWIGRKNDYSYGVYIYGFLIQQVTAYFGWYRIGYLPWAIVCLLISVGCAWLSWHLIEKRAMSLKSWGPGRGFGYWASLARGRLSSRGSRV